jgi:GT2 family glycosyltransferase
MKVSVIIVNYNTEDHLKECLKSIIYFTKNIQYEIVVVDNNSGNRNIERFPQLFPQVKFYFRNINDGFGAGCNFGAKRASGKYFIFVNPDIVLDSNCIFLLFDFMEKNKNVGACTPLLKDFNGELTYIYNNFPGINWEIKEATGIGAGVKISKLLAGIKTGSKVSIEVDWVTGAFLMIRSKLFHQVNGYDEDFFLYYEDTDLQYRIRKLGYKIMCLPSTEVKHFINSSIRSTEGENVFFFNINRSKLIYMYKHFNFLKRNIIRCMHITGIIIRMVILPFREKFKGKKNQKVLQYKRMLLLYFSSHNKLSKSSY